MNNRPVGSRGSETKFYSIATKNDLIITDLNFELDESNQYPQPLKTKFNIILPSRPSGISIQVFLSQILYVTEFLLSVFLVPQLIIGLSLTVIVRI
jgi:hypothetical protein